MEWEIEDGWVLNVPGKWPLEYNNTEEALTAFASIKRSSILRIFIPKKYQNYNRMNMSIVVKCSSRLTHEKVRLEIS